MRLIFSSTSLAQALRPMSMAAVPKSLPISLRTKITESKYLKGKYKDLKGWSEWQDSKLRPLRPEPGYRAA
jgi:hypothetical protein